MLTCKQTSDLISQGLDRHLPFSQRLGVRIHLLMCSTCRQYEKQLRFIRQATGKLSQDAESRGQAAPPLPAKARERIKSALKQKLE